MAGALVVLALVASAILAHVLLRDPEPRFAERRSRLARVDEGTV